MNQPPAERVEPQPLAGRTITVCRSRQQSGELRRRLEAAGASVIVLPLIEVVGPTDEAPLAATLNDLGRFDWVLFTSANAVRAIASRLPTPWPPRTRIAVVGSATAAAARDAGWEVAFTPSEATAATLSTEVPIGAGQRALAPLAELASDDLVSGLGARGVDVVAVEAYRTVTPAHDATTLEAAAHSDAVALTSPSIVDRWVGAVGKETAATIATVSIGPVTADRVRHHGLISLAIAEPHTSEGLTNAIVSAIGSPQNGPADAR